MTPSKHTEQVDSGCFAVLSSCFRVKRKGRSPITIHPSDQTSPQNYDTKTSEPKTLLLFANDLGTTLLKPSDTLDTLDNSTLSVENEKPNFKEENDLWQEAFEEIDLVAKQQINENFSQSGNESPVESLIRLVRDQEARFRESSAKIKVGERVIIWRDYAARVVDGLTVLGDTAIQFAPAPSSIVWSALKVLLKAHVSECESLAAILGCATQVLPLVRCGVIYEKVYLKSKSSELHGPTISLREALVNLYASILRLLARTKHDLNTGGAKRFLYALLHPGEDGELVQDLEKAKTQLSFVLQACEAVQTNEHNKEARKLLESLAEPLRHIDKRVKTILDQESEKERTEMLDIFSNAAFGDQHHRRTKSRTKGTGTWLLTHPKFQDWETSSSSSILWLTGKMGAGKSVLTSNVVDRYWVKGSSEDKPINEGFAFFYYSKNDQELKGDPVAHVLASFLRQLATVPHYPEHVYNGLVKLCRHMKDNKVTFDTKLCKETLSELVDLLPRTFIILDGLDEFENPSDVEDIVGFLVELGEKSEHPVKIFISSRGEPYIQDELLKANHNLAQIDFSNENQPDIEKFVHKRMERIGRFWEPSLKDEVIETLCNEARGMFRWVYLQIEQLATIESPEEVLKRLKSLPKGLEEAYDELYNANSGWDQTRLQRAVKWVMYAREPFPTEMLLSAIRLGLNGDNDKLCLDIAERISEEALENICRHLIVKDRRGNWKFPHASVEEYFRSEKHISWTSYNAQTELAKLSLLLLTKIFRNLRLPESDEEAEDLVNRTGGNDEAQHPEVSLRNYVAEHWISHVKAIQDEPNECTSIPKLLKCFMIAQDSLYCSSLEYRMWTRFVYLRRYYMSADIITVGLQLRRTENPAFGIVALGLHTAAKSWGEDCLKQNLAHLNNKKLDLLSLAAENGHPELCVKLIKWGSDVNRILPKGFSALKAAIHAHRTACVSALLKHGANPNLKTEHGDSLLCRAVLPGYYKPTLYGLLLSHDANPDLCPNDTCSFSCALEAAAHCDNLDGVERLIKAGATVDLRRGKYGSPLAAAAYYCSLKIVKILIDHGADVNIYCETGDYGGVLAAAFCGTFTLYSDLGDTGVRIIDYLIEKAGADPRRIISDLSSRQPQLEEKMIWRREVIAIYLCSHNYITLDELRGLESRCRRMFSDGFLSSLESGNVTRADPGYPEDFSYQGPRVGASNIM
ncbi:hypothetical protein F4860DRAFT_199063 [Xylaria cubensis]|nr:hypothetical protein F4860DRAFT_199063 [Xylaria cubensis]